MFKDLPDSIHLGDYVRCYGDRHTAQLIGEVVGLGPVNIKVRCYYNPGGLPESIEQIHKVARNDVKEVQRGGG